MLAFSVGNSVVLEKDVERPDENVAEAVAVGFVSGRPLTINDELLELRCWAGSVAVPGE